MLQNAAAPSPDNYFWKRNRIELIGSIPQGIMGHLRLAQPLHVVFRENKN